jgi:glycosyltransferase involved in cell wall biosynthesis
MISTAGLARRITLAGECPPQSVARAYRAADAFVLPSFHEGYGMAYAEAMAHGLPVIATTAGAIPETVPRQAGLLVFAG